MQEALLLDSPKQLLLGSVVAWMAIAVATPSHVANYDFRHFNSDDSLTISFSKSSPPLAILEDEKLTVSRAVPSAVTAVSANTAKTWPRLQHYARLFDHGGRFSQQHKHVTKNSPYTSTSRIASKLHQPHLAKISPIRELIGLVQPIIENDLKPNVMVRAGFAQSPQIYSLVHRLAAAGMERRKQGNELDQNATRPMNVRDDVERPLTAPLVPRGLPRGEDAPPVIIQGDRASEQSLNQEPLHVIRAVADEDPSTEAQIVAGAFVPATTKKVPLPSVNQPVYGAPAPSVAPNSYSNAKVNVPSSDAPSAQPANSQNMGVYALDGGTPNNQDHKMAQRLSTENTDQFTIVGQVELTGGLAATGYSTKLNVQWKTGNQTRDADIDYSSGKFAISVPSLDAGKVIGTIVDDSGRTLGRGDYDLDGVAVEGQKSIDDVTLTIEAEDTSIKGQVRSAYSVDKVFVPVKGAEIFGPSQTREVADDKGNFRLAGLNSDSTLLADSYATDYWGTRVLASGRMASKIPLFSDRMIESFLEILGQGGDSSSYGIVWGAVSHKGKPVAGARVALSEAGAMGPIYFNELRIPDKSLATTSTNGLYAFIKVKPGLDIVEAQYNQRELPSTVVSVSPSMVSYSEISFKSLTLQGRVFDPVSNQNLSAQISVVGTSRSARSDTNGFNLKIPSSDPVVFIEANAGSGYMISREAVPRSEAHEINLMAYKKEWVADQLRQVGMKYDDSRGVLLGYVESPKFTVRLDDAADVQEAADANDQNVIYFNEKGSPDSSLIEGVAGGGVFMMTNLKPGLHTLVVSAASGEMTTSRLFVSESGVLNVLSMPLRP